MSRLSHLLLIIAPLTFAAPKHKASDYFKVCSRDQLKDDNCIYESLMEAKDKLMNGIPELKMPPFDPLEVEEMTMGTGTGSFKLSTNLKNYKIRGLSGMKVEYVKADENLQWVNMSSVVPLLASEADYNMTGRIMALPVKGDGHAYINMTDVAVKLNMKMTKIEKKEQEYMQVDKLILSLKNKGGSFYFTNLFNGDKTLGDAFNKFMNDNQEEVFRIYGHLPENGFNQLMKELVNNLLMAFPYKEWVKE